MKKIKKTFVMILTSALLVGSVITADAATYSLTKACPVGNCGQSNIHSSVTSGKCRFFVCPNNNIYSFSCSRCGTSYKVCGAGHYQ